MPTIISSVNNVIKNNFYGIKNEIKTLDFNYDELFYKKYDFLELNGTVHKILQQKIMNDVVRLNNNYLTFIYDKVDVSKQAKNVIKLNKYLKKKKIPYIYIQSPFKISKYVNQLPVGIKDYTNENADNFLKIIANNGVDVFDFRKELESRGTDYYSLFYKTDQHWKIETSFWAFSKIVSLLNEKYDFAIDNKLSNFGNYKSILYKKKNLGSYGKRTGINYAGTDDFYIITPKFKTKLSLSIPSEKIIRSGSFSKSIFDKKMFYGSDRYNEYPYHIYIGTDAKCPLVIIKNLTKNADKKVLIIKDSYAQPVESFLSMCVKEIHAVDLRYYTDMALVKYIDKIKPDIVINMYGAEYYEKHKMFEFFNKLN